MTTTCSETKSNAQLESLILDSDPLLLDSGPLVVVERIMNYYTHIITSKLADFCTICVAKE